MPTLLDQRPTRKAPILFGRALVEQQRAEADAREKNRDDLRQEAAQKATEKHLQLADEIAKAKLHNEVVKQNLEMELKLREVRQENEQIVAFARAQKQVAALSPTDPMLPGKIAQIQAGNNILFAGKGTQYAHALGSMVTDLIDRRKTIEAARETKVKEATKFEVEHGIKVPLDANGEPDLAAASKQRIDAGKSAAAAAGMQPSSFTDPSTGVTSKVPVDKSGMDQHQLQQLYLQDYHAVEKERSGIKYKPEKDASGKEVMIPQTDEHVVKMLDARREQALKNLQSVGINLEGAVSGTDAPVTAVVTPDAPLDRMDLARAAIEDPAASLEHKSAARKLLGYEDEAPQ